MGGELEAGTKSKTASQRVMATHSTTAPLLQRAVPMALDRDHHRALVDGNLDGVATSSPGRIQRMEVSAVALADAGPSIPPRVQRRAQSTALVQREAVDSRAASLKAIDQAASERRMAHARDEYMFDKSLSSGDESLEATNDRMTGQKGEVAGNDVNVSPVFAFLYKRNPALAIQQFGYTPTQAATIYARMKERSSIPKPADLLPPGQVAAHLGKFANGAHAFIDPSSSGKIEGSIEDARFKGWGIDANFVAPLDEANALNAKAHKERGIETIEDELGIPSKYWSKSEWNPKKELVRWVIPKPKLNLDEEGAGVVLEMATGQESGADPRLWVAGGLTKGGASEAVLKAIPRENLIKHLAEGSIRQKIETYPETRDGIV